MANEPNMKVTYTSDSSKFVAGTRQAKNAVRDFQKTTDSALAEIGDAFGVNTGKVNQLANAIQGMGVKMTKSGNDSVKALGNVLLSLDKVKLGIAGLGIGAAIASFKALNETAEAFKKTVQGANLEMMTAAYVDTYRRAFFDMNSAQGQAFANFGANMKKAGAAAGAIFTNLLVNQGQKVSTSLLGIADPTFWRDTIGGMKEANAKASQAEEIAGRIYELQRRRSDQAVEIADTENRIAELKNKIWDKSNSEVERAGALREVQELIRQKYTEQYDIESEIADLMEQQNSLTNSTPAEIDAANQQRIKANSLAAQMNGELKSLLRQQNSLNGAASTHAKTEATAAKELAQVSATVADLSSRRAERVSAVAEIEARIADLRRQAADSATTEADRAAAVAEAQTLVRTELAAQYAQETQLADAMARVNELGTATPDAIDKANRQRVLAISLMAEQQRQLREIAALQGESIEFSESEVDIEQKILELRGIAMDLASSEETRAEAIATAHELIRQKYAQQYSLEMSLAASLEERARLNGNDADILEEANQHREKALSLYGSMKSDLQELIAFQKELTERVNRTTEAYGSMAGSTRIENFDLSVKQDLGNFTYSKGQNVSLAGDLGKVQEVKKAIIDIRSELTNLAAEGASAIGSLIGDLINGEDAWSNFGNAALEALGDMAVAVGKTIMQEGIAVEAAKLALTTMSGVGAIAAGAALVAIGSALKTSLKNAAAGNYSASSSVASSSYRGTGMSSSSVGYEQREIRVTGALVASGNQLIAVINNENNRTSHTT